MRTIHWVCAVTITLAASVLMAQPPAPTAPKKLTPEEVTKLLHQPETVLFIDVREPSEIAATGTLKGALMIPLGELEGRLSEVSKSKQIVPFCRRGGRAARAAGMLEEKGYKPVGIFGLEEYREALKDYIVVPKQG